MKKRDRDGKISYFVIILLLSMLLGVSLVVAQDDEDNIDVVDEGSGPPPPPTKDIPEPESTWIFNGTSNAEQNFRDKKEVFQRYGIFVFLDDVFTKGSIISRVLFGIHYEFEFFWALGIAYWLLFLLFIPGIIRNLTGWSVFSSTMLALLVNTALAQMLIFKGLSFITVGLIGQGSIFGIILFLFMFAILLVCFSMIYILAVMVKKRRENRFFTFKEREKDTLLEKSQLPEGDYQRA